MGYSNNMSTITCDCCTLSLTQLMVGYMEVKIGTNVYVLCNAKGCSSGLLTALQTELSTAATAHRATTVAGVILPH